MLKEKRGRRYWMDALRGIAVLLVIIQHAVTVPLFDGYESLDVLTRVNDALAPYRVPMLLTLSGMLLHRSLLKGLYTYAVGKLRQIVWPLILWTPVVLALSPKLWGSITAWVGPRHLWFLVTLVFCYIIGVATLRINAGWLCIALVALYTIPAVSAIEGSHLLWYGAYFMFGAWVASYLQWWQKTPWWLAALLVVIAGGWAWVAATGVEIIAPAEFLLSLSGLGALLWVGPRLPRMQWAEWVGQRSIVFYIVHVPAMIIALRIIGGIDGVGDVALSLAMIVIGFSVPFALTARYFAWMFAFPAGDKTPISSSTVSKQ